MEHGFSNENQSSADACYRFGEFELYPRDRLLKKWGATISLPPKSFDALLCMIGRAGHLVSKRELMKTLWPDVHVADANVTNTIVSLRKVLGRDAIRTVSKHGYCFNLGVCSAPGVAPATYERFVRAKQLTIQRSLKSMTHARDLLWTCLAEDPAFASAWAYMGRCCAFLQKFNAAPASELVQAAFDRAFALDPDLACAHQFYTLVQVDAGQAKTAIERLFQRMNRHPAEPESLAGLVQAYRFCGLLEESIEAHKQATELDPTVVTSVAHTYFLNGEFGAAIEAYASRGSYYLDAAAWAALGERKRAAALLRKRLRDQSLSDPVASLMKSLLAVLEDRTEDAVTIMDGNNTVRDPEIVVYLARHYAAAGRESSAIVALRQAAQLGFSCSPKTLRNDPWFRSLRNHKSFAVLLGELDASVQETRSVLTLPL
jgi:DNA-binding winged helix-turn-helix (wHTH) protein